MVRRPSPTASSDAPRTAALTTSRALRCGEVAATTSTLGSAASGVTLVLLSSILSEFIPLLFPGDADVKAGNVVAPERIGGGAGA